MQTFKLNDGTQIPSIGFGTFQIPADGSTVKAVRTALDLGIRHIDTAVAYFNEQEVGQAIRESGVKRGDIWITSKMWLQDFRYEDAKKSIDLSLRKLGTDYMDLYLVHQPYGAVEEAWQAMEEAQKAGKIRSIGVSNMTPKIWNSFVPKFNVKPSVNQVEFNPYFQQRELRGIVAETGTRIEAWAPLGQGNADLMKEEAILDIASKHGKNPGQVILRFENQEGVIVFPKSTRPERIKGNMEIFDFELSGDEMQAIRALDRGHGMHDPDAPGVGEWLLAHYDVHKDD
jgi:diketogulonate reductase-like aldo/keto reductase